MSRTEGLSLAGLLLAIAAALVILPQLPSGEPTTLIDERAPQFTERKTVTGFSIAPVTHVQKRVVEPVKSALVVVNIEPRKRVTEPSPPSRVFRKQQAPETEDLRHLVSDLRNQSEALRREVQEQRAAEERANRRARREAQQAIAEARRARQVAEEAAALAYRQACAAKTSSLPCESININVPPSLLRATNEIIRNNQRAAKRLLR
jgi:flagellar biosynthesis GTPase FlhF